MNNNLKITKYYYIWYHRVESGWLSSNKAYTKHILNTTNAIISSTGRDGFRETPDRKGTSIYYSWGDITVYSDVFAHNYSSNIF